MKTIDGYTLKTTPSNATGTFTKEDITVIYVYEADEQPTSEQPTSEQPISEQPKKNIADCTINLEYATTTYTGRACKPAVTVRDGETILQIGTDYEVIYKDNINVGIASVTISGKGGYTGSVSRSFTIAESEQSPDEDSSSHSEASTMPNQTQADESQTASEQKTQGDTTPAQSASAVTSSTTQAATETKAKDHPTSVNLKNKKTYKKTTKVKIKDSDGIKGIKLNSKKLTIKAGKKSVSFKISKYKKYLKKKGKWNKLVVTDMNGKKKTIKFKVK